jgi:ribosomal protein S27AE
VKARGMGWLVKTYASRGIIVAERACRRCGVGMVLAGEGMVWRCLKCWREVSLTKGSVIPKKMSLEVFDLALNLWIDLIPPSHAKKLIDTKNPHLLPDLYTLFR